MIGVRTQERRPSDLALEKTLQFRMPVLDQHAVDELQARLYLLSRHLETSPVARARLSIVRRFYEAGKEQKILNAFDAQNRAVLEGT